MTTQIPAVRRSLIQRIAPGGWMWALMLLCVPLVGRSASWQTPRQFNLPVDAAEASLKRFSEQSGLEVLFATRTASGVTTNAVHGTFVPMAALARLLADTGLTAEHNEVSGVIIIKQNQTPAPMKTSVLTKIRKALIGALLSVTTISHAPAQEAVTGDQPSGETKESVTPDAVVKLQPFEVTSEKDYGYRRTNSTTSSRIGVPIVSEPTAIEVVSSELLKDFSIQDYNQVFRYSSGVTVGESEVGQAGIFTLRGFEMPRLVNGMPLTNSFSLTPYLVTDNLDRIEIAKGAVSLYYGNSTPNGVANYVTKRPQFTKATRVELSGGSYNFAKVAVDTQDTINPSIAYRMVTSWQAHDGRVNEQHSEYVFVAPSVTFRPNDKFQVDAEFNYTKYHVAYPSFAWFWAYNPQYYSDVASPSQAVLEHFKATYGLADDAAARAKVAERWNSNANVGSIYNQSVLNWASDMTTISGGPVWPMAGDSIDWWRFSTDGDQAYQYTPVSNPDGSSWLADVAVTLTPLPNLAIRYHWLHQDTASNFVRVFILPNGGMSPDGRWESMNLKIGLSATLDYTRIATSDAQQLDAVYETDAFGMKHKLVAGLEWDRAVGKIGSSAVDYNQAADPALWSDWNPFAGVPLPDYDSVIAGISKIGTTSIASYKAWYASYRGSAFDGRLNVMAGIRHSEQENPSNSSNTPTVGAIFEVAPGFHAFASYSTSVLFTNSLSVIGPGVLPSDNQHRLDNEEDEGVEIGIKTDWRDNTLSGTVSYYRAERSGLVKGDLAKVNADPRNQGYDQSQYVQFFVNGGVARTEGIDFDLAWTPNARFQAMLSAENEFTAKNISDPSVDPATSDARLVYRTYHQRLQKSPKWRGSLVVKYHCEGETLQNLSVGGAVRYSDTYLVNSNYLLDLWVPSEVLVDVFANYRTKIFATPADVHLTLLNVTNKINDLTRNNGFEARLSLGFTF